MATVYGYPDDDETKPASRYVAYTRFSRAKGLSELCFSKKVLTEVQENGTQPISSDFGQLDDMHDNRL